MLVNAGRTLSLFTTRKLATQETSCSTFAERWYDWIKTERRIRTAFAIFLIDSELAIFFRTLNQSLKSWKCYWDKKLSLEKLCNAEDLSESRLGESLHWLARLLVHINPETRQHEDPDLGSLDWLHRLIQDHRKKDIP
ncbi:hypothetical protein FOXG_20233 [Fusarium oxysporum f. sp. lycopersici 4287]|uniref:Transcription factor domain-containing protein n=2 Tax=Fusarium oxysporum TaxID=5507 RepID=A0A0J9VEZ7_FUSO4|nr:hypothetical protein FOXG_20233 [Fusarium oxysporum f. sp. lycopersici 4287]EXK27593.1 hypothetical protein FOMG_15830 [Fusarium oxysporum f. sp. melonis 26406]KNB09578.1 hypothetical protein FOXG_20233 [Fusarium oxysporum f. sp. lycopersici 4287]